MDSPVIGIDFGTTHCCVGVFHGGKVEIIANDLGNRTTPSYVAFTGTGILIGEAAKNQFMSNQNNTIFDIKRLMGRVFDDDTVQVDMKYWGFQVINTKHNKLKIKVKFQGIFETYHPENICSMVLRKMKETAEAYLGKKVKNAVITVPVYFNDSQKAATVNAAKMAGLNILRIIYEPTAAAMAYGLEKKDSDVQKVLVFNLGGKTFEVSILTIQNGVFEVISTVSDPYLGGEDFDFRMVYHFVEEFKRQHKVDLAQNQKVLHRLLTVCEMAKRNLSSATVVDIEIDSLYYGIDFYSSISRARFEDLNSDFFRSAMASVEKAIENAEINKSQIDHVILVGGSCRIPKVQKMVQDFFGGKELHKSINPEEAIAYGAAAPAAVLHTDKLKETQDLELLSVAPLSLGVGFGADCSKMSMIIERNTPIPIKRSEVFTTSEHNQTSICIKVYEGEYTTVKDNHLLGQFTLSGIPPAPAGEARIDETFEIDANDILKVTAVERSTGRSNQLSIKYDRGRLSKNQIELMVTDVKKREVQERKRKADIVAKNDLESYCFKLKEKIDQFDKDVIMKKCEDTILWLNSNPLGGKELYKQKQTELQNVSRIIDTLNNLGVKRKHPFSTNQLTITYNESLRSKDEIERMIKDTEKSRTQVSMQEKKRKSTAARKSLRSYCFKMMSIVKDEKLRDNIDKFDKNLILRKCTEVISWSAFSYSYEKELYERKHEELRNLFDVIVSIAECPGKKKR